MVTHSDQLVEVAKIGLASLEQQLEDLLGSVCLLNADLTPRRDTIEPQFAEEATELEANIARAKAVIAAAEAAHG